MTMSRFFNITTSDDGTSTIFLYGDIGDYTEVQSGRIAQELMEAERVMIKTRFPGAIGMFYFRIIERRGRPPESV